VNLKSPDVYLKSAGDVRTATWLGTFGLGCSVAVTAYLAALRRRTATRRTWQAAVVVGGLLGLATFALALQQLAYPYLLRRAAGTHAPQTPALLILHSFGELYLVGTAAASGTLLLIMLAVLGVAATALILLSRLRIEFDPGTGRRSRRPAGRGSGSPPRPVPRCCSPRCSWSRRSACGHG